MKAVRYFCFCVVYGPVFRTLASPGAVSVRDGRFLKCVFSLAFGLSNGESVECL